MGDPIKKFINTLKSNIENRQNNLRKDSPGCFENLLNDLKNRNIYDTDLERRIRVFTNDFEKDQCVGLEVSINGFLYKELKMNNIEYQIVELYDLFVLLDSFKMSSDSPKDIKIPRSISNSKKKLEVIYKYLNLFRSKYILAREIKKSLRFDNKPKVNSESLITPLGLDTTPTHKAPTKEISTNPYPKIFTDEGYKIFEHYRVKVSEKSQSAEFGFLFDEMQKENFIHDTVSRTYFYRFLIQEFDLKHLSDKLSSKYSRTQYTSKYGVSKLAVKSDNKQ